MADFDRELMLEMFAYEMSQLLEQLEQTVIQGESGYSMEEINEIFRIMHTIKGSAAMMMFHNISTSAHAIEDLFFYLREENPSGVDYPCLTDLVLEGMDFVKAELSKIEAGSSPDGDGSDIVQRIKTFLQELKGANAGATPVAAGFGNHYKALILFEDGCEMENIRAYTLVHNLGDDVCDVKHIPEDIIDEESIGPIRKSGFHLYFSSHLSYDEIYQKLSGAVYLRELVLEQTPQPMGIERRLKVVVRFEQGVEMENVRAYALVHNLEEKGVKVTTEPPDLIDEACIPIIQRQGVALYMTTFFSDNELDAIFAHTAYVNDYQITEETAPPEAARAAEPVPEAPAPEAAAVPDTAAPARDEPAEALRTVPAVPAAEALEAKKDDAKKAPVQHMISVNVSKLDQLLNLMGELVITEAMVTQNPDLNGLTLENFHREAMQLRKIINDVQENVMSMRMVPLSTTFFKMHRIVRDMCRQLQKDVELEIIGEETEVDKNIIEHIGDPLMHVIRNSVDHGIETPGERLAKGKPPKGVVRLEAKNSGGDVLIIVQDDGGGIDRNAVLNKAKNNGLLRKPENEYTDKEIYQFIFLPGFSTNQTVTSYSGRGVGMDVVSTNLEMVGGSVLVDSAPGEGSTFTMKIPLTLAIIEGMTIRLGDAKYTIPIVSIKQSFKAKAEDIFCDPDGNEMIKTRGEVYNVLRLNEFFGLDSGTGVIEDGILINLENGEQSICLFVDELIGEQQVVVKTMPKYINKIKGLSGCTLLGNGEISLIIDVAGLFDK